MHPGAREGFGRMLAKCNGQASRGFGRVLDLGGQDVYGGTVHNHRLLRASTIDVLDIQAGAGVTIVDDARTWRPKSGDDLYDLAISTELLEHVEDWHKVIETARSALPLGRWFVGTCASIGRAPHGATGADRPAEGEYYRNVDPAILVAELDRWFSVFIVEYQNDPSTWTTHDLYWRAQA